MQDRHPTRASLQRDASITSSARHALLPWLDTTFCPLPAPRLVRREAQIHANREHLGENVLIYSGTGEAGMGTRALARSITHVASDDYPDGCISADLRRSGSLAAAPLTVAQVQQRVLRTLHIGTHGGDLPEDSLALLRMYESVLSERKVLLLLDDAQNPNLGEMGRLSMQSSDNRRALDCFERQSEMARKAGAPDLEADALTNAGVAQGALGDVKAAERSWQRALSLFEQSQDPRAIRVGAGLKELQNRSDMRA